MIRKIWLQSGCNGDENTAEIEETPNFGKLPEKMLFHLGQPGNRKNGTSTRLLTYIFKLMYVVMYI